jgi:predicted SnoaL-like aldol condensation-catalyzing enzyme
MITKGREEKRKQVWTDLKRLWDGKGVEEWDQ